MKVKLITNIIKFVKNDEYINKNLYSCGERTVILYMINYNKSL